MRGEVYISSRGGEYRQKGDNMNYKNKDTGMVYTQEELKEIWSQFGYESRYASLEEMLEDMEETDEESD
jgi:hypothetical protein